MRVIRIVPVLVILTATVLVASLFTFSVVGSVDAFHIPVVEELKAVSLFVERIDIVHTDDQAVKRVITVRDFGGSPTSINLLFLQSGILTTLGICDDIPDGVVTQIRLVVIGASITFDGKTFDLIIPGGEVKLNGVLTVSNDEDGIFEFDAEKSLIPVRDGVFKLKPVLKFGTTNTDC